MADPNEISKSWQEKTEKNIDAEKYTQLCVWPDTILGEGTPSEFEQFMLENFGTRVRFAEEVVTLPGDGGPGGRHDLFFYAHNDDLGKFAVPRLQVGIRWWEDVVGNRSHLIYPKDVIDKYPKTW
jgi:hypothetical protein